MEKFLQARNRVGANGGNTKVDGSVSKDPHGPITPKSGSSGEKSAEMEAKLYQALKIVFGFQEFRPQQLNIVKQILQNKDVFVVMPTVCVFVGVCLLVGRTYTFGLDEIRHFATATVLGASFRAVARLAIDVVAVVQ
jgi:uncharacterized membrane protein YgdD (TMEM256/DUF423 family)